ncbi:unnamed protein product [Miscanthus lutarioriparius]|uniref:Uncharacterized protein n=1 Tax=Miscanthus lutarioriparius TaxID=422564 RepID=A0A811NPK9_9POAL|nr:unnamed protein product [Miscanthus lutarioriparius]
MEQKARRRRVPAFVELNYNYYGSAELVATPTAAAVPFERYAAKVPELEARSDVWFKYSPPPRKPPPVSRKVRRPAEKSYGGSKRPRAATPARASDGVVPSSVPRTPAKSTGAARAARVVQRVNADLYQVPPPEFVHDDDLRPRRKQRQRKKASRSLWMGCFGFSCRPAE